MISRIILSLRKAAGGPPQGGLFLVEPPTNPDSRGTNTFYPRGASRSRGEDVPLDTYRVVGGDSATTTS